MSPTKNHNYLAVAVEAALAASHIIMEALEKPRVANHKGKTDLVTVTDLNSENIIKSIIRASYPDHGLLAEESVQESSQSDFLWIIDPLDGTTNFVHGYPCFAVSIGLFFQNKPLIAAVLEMPNTKLYTAIKNEGVWCEGQPISCSITNSLEKSLLVTGFGYEHGEHWEKNMRLFQHFTDKTQGVRRLGAAAVDLCHVASGKVDGFWEFDIKPWDTAAGILIATESGCIVTQMNGSDYSIYDNNILVANPKIHSEMIKEIKSVI
ncbi:inositol monophosphatase [Candidatus Marinimicrobia bacterium]|nr:inositol monophosphatase [Candidatus Neomarinimicrobiota bacterium]MDC1038523.1 inositol monophosphatase [Candidatus Neomarinimicrobiota bacterium]